MPTVRNRTENSSQFLACDKGSSAIEFAILAPVLLLLFFGIIVFGLYLGASHNLKQLAAEAARASIAGINDQERSDLATRRVANALAGGAMFKPGSVEIKVGPDPADTEVYLVTLSFDARNLGLSGLSGLVPLPPDLIRSTVSVRRGGL